MTLLELIEEVHEKTHVDRVEIFSQVRLAWGEERPKYTATQCALLVRALDWSTASPKCVSPLRRV